MVSIASLLNFVHNANLKYNCITFFANIRILGHISTNIIEKAAYVLLLSRENSSKDTRNTDTNIKRVASAWKRVL
jgi:hypothetical protein